VTARVWAHDDMAVIEWWGHIVNVIDDAVDVDGGGWRNVDVNRVCAGGQDGSWLTSLHHHRFLLW
jgi:hypothetical protein